MAEAYRQITSAGERANELGASIKVPYYQTIRKGLERSAAPRKKVGKRYRYNSWELLAWAMAFIYRGGDVKTGQGDGLDSMGRAQIEIELKKAQVRDKQASARARERINEVAEGGLIPVEAASHIVADGLGAASRLLRDALADMTREGQDVTKMNEVQTNFEQAVESIVSQFVDVEGQTKAQAASDLKKLDRQNAQ